MLTKWQRNFPFFFNSWTWVYERILAIWTHSTQYLQSFTWWHLILISKWIISQFWSLYFIYIINSSGKKLREGPSETCNKSEGRSSHESIILLENFLIYIRELYSFRTCTYYCFFLHSTNPSSHFILPIIVKRLIFLWNSRTWNINNISWKRSCSCGRWK